MSHTRGDNGENEIDGYPTMLPTIGPPPSSGSSKQAAEFITPTNDDQNRKNGNGTVLSLPANSYSSFMAPVEKPVDASFYTVTKGDAAGPHETGIINVRTSSSNQKGTFYVDLKGNILKR